MNTIFDSQGVKWGIPVRDYHLKLIQTAWGKDNSSRKSERKMSHKRRISLKHWGVKSQTIQTLLVISIQCTEDLSVMYSIVFKPADDEFQIGWTTEKLESYQVKSEAAWDYERVGKSEMCTFSAPDPTPAIVSGSCGTENCIFKRFSIPDTGNPVKELCRSSCSV